MRIGAIVYEIPNKRVGFDHVRHLFVIGGKDLVRMAWSSLVPNDDNAVKHEFLANWFEETLFLDVGCGHTCIKKLCSLGLLHQFTYSSWGGEYYYNPAFRL